jgi:hypothetical protein
MRFIKALLPVKRLKWMRLLTGRQIIAARRVAVTDIVSDRPAISITSGSSVTISSKALIKPCNNSFTSPLLNRFHIVSQIGTGWICTTAITYRIKQ